jgi:hypothetical protein
VFPVTLQVLARPLAKINFEPGGTKRASIHRIGYTHA